MVTKTDSSPLPSDNLGSRQRAHNKKVNDALASNIDFTTVKDKIEITEVDRFFKIDLAAKCKNLDYILEMLMSGDTLYATRALKKSQWLYTDEYSHIINPEYLDTNVFPVTSERVKRIILKTVAMRVRREDRAIGFFTYCLKTGLPDIAFKSLLFTSDSFKLDIMQNYKKPPYDKIKNKKLDYFKFIIGNSLTLLEAYLKMVDRFHTNILMQFRFLYPVNNLKYLELCEKFINTYYCIAMKFDKQLCIDIMVKYKERVLAKPLFYIEMVQDDILLKNSTVDDVKVYLIAFLPTDAQSFWSCFFSQNHSNYLNVIPQNERYAFLKKIFTDKYPGEDFEMSKWFYTQHYYKLMTAEEREEWAWNQIKSDKQVLGVGKDYLWYKFINFKEAFEEIKNYVIVTKEAERRKGIIKVLIYSAQNNRELEILLKHYHRRHNNELRLHKEYFLDKVIDYHNVFEFDEACWNTFYTLLLGMELYNTIDYKDCNKRYLTIVLFYYIVYEKDMPEELSKYLLNDFVVSTSDDYWFIGHRTVYGSSSLISKMTEQKRQFLYIFLFTFYTDRIKELKNESYTSEINQKVERYFRNVLSLMHIFNPHHEVTEGGEFYFHSSPKVRNVDTSLSGLQLLRQLKKDKTFGIDTLMDVKKRFENVPFNIDGFVKKIKIYFPDDVTNTFASLFEQILTNDNIDQKSVDACVKAFFELGDVSEIIHFMKKYAPENNKIDHNVIDPQHLRIQKAICKYACIPRPPVPLSAVLLYMKGDYVKYCLHLFNTYPVVLPLSKCIEFVKALIDAPVSIQKHALRLAFKCFDAQKLKQISLDYWKNTKNVSVRCVIYKGLYNRLVERNEEELYDALKPLTLDLHDTDHRDLFDLIGSNELSDQYLGDYKEISWEALSNFKDKQPNIQRKLNLLSSIREQIHLIREQFVSQIVEEHVQLMLCENKLFVIHSTDEIKDLYIEKWNLTGIYILHFATTRDVIEKYLETVQFVFKKFVEMWYETYDGMYIYQEYCWSFFRQLKENSLCPKNPVMYEKSLPIFERILKVVKSDLPLFESYMLRWELQLGMINRKVVKSYRLSFGNEVKPEVVDESLVSFSQEVGKLISSMINDKVYFMSYTEKTKDAISDSITELLNVIYLESDEDQTKHNDNAIVTFTTGLVKFETLETFLLAVQLLPTNCSECSSDKYQALIDIIKGYSEPEVKHALHQKLPAYCNKKS